jgi:hypothetical protein
MAARQKLEGELVAADDTTVSLRLAGSRGVVTVPRDAITRLDVRRSPSRRWRGAAIGAGVGLVAGGAILAQGDSDERALLSIYTVPLGALFGYALAPSAQWEKHASVGSLRVGLAPVRGRGLAAAVSFGF